ncbi:MAG: glycosyltransferase [Eubacteriales bacterium]
MTLDRKYLSPLTVMLDSYRAVHTDVITDLYVVHSSLEESDFSLIEKAVDKSNTIIHNIRVTEKYFSETPVLERLPEESFYRLLAFSWLPEDVERCIYLDPDTYILKSLLPLYATDIGDAYIAAAGHMHGFRDVINKARLGIESEKYINSGVMLMNLRGIRKDFTIDSILESLEQSVQRLLMGDQDLINILFGDRTVFLDERVYNLDERTYKYFHKKQGFDTDSVKEQTAIIHYNGKYKPWLEGYKGVLDSFYPEVPEKGPAPTKVWQGVLRSVFRITRLNRRQKITAAAILLFLCMCGFSYFFFGKELSAIVSDPASFRMWLDKLGPFDEIVFILIRAAQTVVKFIPAEPLEIGAGYAWGAIPGMIYCIIGNLLGTFVILALTRKFGKKIISFFSPVGGGRMLSALKGSDRVYEMLFLLYLIPGLPKDGFTYFVGLLPIKTLPFLIITGIARTPSVLSSTLCGATLADKQYIISGLIFAATIILAFLGALAYRFLLKRKEKKSNKVGSVG